MTPGEHFVDVGDAESLPDGEMRQADVDGEDVLLARVGDSYFAVSNVCTHAVGWLDMGAIYPETCEVECPLHNGRFDLRTGKATAEPCVDPLPTYRAKVQNGRLLVDVSPADQ